MRDYKQGVVAFPAAALELLSTCENHAAERRAGTRNTHIVLAHGGVEVAVNKAAIQVDFSYSFAYAGDWH